MEKRYGVFVSSTFVDLADERRAVMQALLELNCIPTGMELFPASDDDSWTLIQSVIDDADYYLVILAGRYGSTDSNGIGYTEKEYDYAVAIGKPVLSFLHADPGAIPARYTERDPEAQRKLAAFRERVEKKQCRYWTTAGDLGIAVMTSYVRLLKTHPAEGWVKGRYAKTTEEAEKLAHLLEQVQVLERELTALRRAGVLDTTGLSQGNDAVSIDYTVGDETGSASTDWNSLFRIVGLACVDLATEAEMHRRLSDWIAQQLLPHAGGPVDLSHKSLQGIKLQFFCLGLIDIQLMNRAHAAGVRPTRVWVLTEAGRAAFASLVGAKRVVPTERQELNVL